MVLGKTLAIPLGSKDTKPVNPEGSQSWTFTARTDAEDALVLWPPDAKSWLTGEDSDAGKDWGQEKGVTEDEVVGWHHWLNGHELEIVKNRKALCAALHEFAKSQRTTTMPPSIFRVYFYSKEPAKIHYKTARLWYLNIWAK